MINTKNINITGPNNKQFQYLVEYEHNVGVGSGVKYEVGDSVVMYDEYINLKRNVNEWDPYEGMRAVGTYIPSSYSLAAVTLYFPEWSVETYEDDVKYALNITTWIHGHEICVGSYLITRLDALACPPKKYSNKTYYECVTLYIPDPYDMVYSDDWKQFRQHVCGETEVSSVEQNNTGSNISISLYPVSFLDNRYILKEFYNGGQNWINMSDPTDYMKLVLDNEVKHKDADGKIIKEPYSLRSKVLFNNAYSSISEYLKETYYIDNPIYRLSIYVMNETDVFDIWSYHDNIEDTNFWIFRRGDFLNSQGQPVLLTWDMWRDDSGNIIPIETMGLRFIETLNVYANETDLQQDIPVITLKSNMVPATQEIWKYLVSDSSAISNEYYINLENIDMTVNNLNIVNKIEKSVVQIERQENNKNNIIKPVFFRVRDLGNLVLHPGVTENVCINLDAYKSQVSTFILQVEGVSFAEYGRTTAGVIFHVIGNKLPGTTQSGTYNILNEDSELVTTGKYTYES